MSNSSNSIIDADFSFQDTPQAPQMALANITNDHYDMSAYTEFMTGDDTPIQLTKLPRLKIFQPNQAGTTSLPFQPGYIVNDLFDSESESITFSILATKESRIHYANKYGSKTEPSYYCRSLDFLSGTPNEKDNKITPKMLEQLKNDSGGEFVCKNCKRKEWGEDGSPPLCSEVYHCFGFDLETEMPFIMDFLKTAHKPFKDLKGKVAGNRILLRQPNGQPIPYRVGQNKFKVDEIVVKVGMKTILKDDGTFKYFVPLFFVQNGNILTPEQSKKALSAKQEYEAMFYMRANEAVEEVVVNDTDTDDQTLSAD